MMLMQEPPTATSHATKTVITTRSIIDSCRSCGKILLEPDQDSRKSSTMRFCHQCCETIIFTHNFSDSSKKRLASAISDNITVEIPSREHPSAAAVNKGSQKNVSHNKKPSTKGANSNAFFHPKHSIVINAHNNNSTSSDAKEKKLLEKNLRIRTLNRQAYVARKIAMKTELLLSAADFSNREPVPPGHSSTAYCTQCQKLIKAMPVEFRNHWQTPTFFLQVLAKMFDLDTDVACTRYNKRFAKCLTEEDNALAKDTRWGKANFCNPPYSPEKNLKTWLRKGLEENLYHNAFSVFLLPGYIQSREWFHLLLENNKDHVSKVILPNMRFTPADSRVLCRPRAQFHSLLVIIDVPVERRTSSWKSTPCFIPNTNHRAGNLSAKVSRAQKPPVVESMPSEQLSKPPESSSSPPPIASLSIQSPLPPPPPPPLAKPLEPPEVNLKSMKKMQDLLNSKKASVLQPVDFSFLNPKTSAHPMPTWLLIPAWPPVITDPNNNENKKIAIPRNSNLAFPSTNAKPFIDSSEKLDSFPTHNTCAPFKTDTHVFVGNPFERKKEEPFLYFVDRPSKRQKV